MRLFRGRIKDEQRETVSLSRREVFTWIVGMVAIVTNIKTWFPQRQVVELSGRIHHRVDAGSVEWKVAVSQPTVTVVRAKAPVALV